MRHVAHKNFVFFCTFSFGKHQKSGIYAIRQMNFTGSGRNRPTVQIADDFS